VRECSLVNDHDLRGRDGSRAESAVIIPRMERRSNSKTGSDGAREGKTEGRESMRGGNGDVEEKKGRGKLGKTMRN